MEPEKKKPRTKRNSGEWKPAFLATLAASGIIRVACEVAGVSRKTLYDHREQDPEFREAWDTALESALDKLEQEAWRRALRSSDLLLMFLLKAGRTNKYRELREVRHTQGVNIEVIETIVYQRPPALLESTPPALPAPDGDGTA